MKFLADGMLGKLTRWLRMLGQNVKYSVQLSDEELLEAAKVEGRVLLTRDFELYKRAIVRGVDAFYVEGITESNRLAEVAKRYGLTLTRYQYRGYRKYHSLCRFAGSVCPRSAFSACQLFRKDTGSPF